MKGLSTYWKTIHFQITREYFSQWQMWLIFIPNLLYSKILRISIADEKYYVYSNMLHSGNFQKLSTLMTTANKNVKLLLTGEKYPYMHSQVNVHKK